MCAGTCLEGHVEVRGLLSSSSVGSGGGALVVRLHIYSKNFYPLSHFLGSRLALKCLYLRELHRDKDQSACLIQMSRNFTYMELP